MKITKLLFASLTLGLLVASCQNGLEEVLEQNAVQEKQATTRAEIETPVDEESTEEYAEGPAISGPKIITGTSSNTFSVIPPPNSVNTVWNYSSYYFNHYYSDNTTLMISLKNANNSGDTTISATFYDSNNNVISKSWFFTGVNGPHSNDCSIRVLRSSDGAEVYPLHNVYMQPNTYYHAYFSTTTGGPNMNLTWSFYGNDVDIISQYGYTLYFKTGNVSGCFLHLDGTLYGSSIIKELLGISIY